MVFYLLNFILIYPYSNYLYLILFIKIFLPYFHLDPILLHLHLINHLIDFNFLHLHLIHHLIDFDFLHLHLLDHPCHFNYLHHLLLPSLPFHYNRQLHFQMLSYLIHLFIPYNLQINQNFHYIHHHYFNFIIHYFLICYFL